MKVAGAPMISFSLTPTPLKDGQIEIVLRLYRAGSIASTTTIARVQRAAASMILVRSRVHLRTLGVHEVGELRPAG